MINLIKADLYKETRKKSFVIICLLIIFVSVIYLLLINRNLKTEKEYIEIYPRLNYQDYLSVYKYGNYKEYEEKYNNYVTFIKQENKRIKTDSSSKTKTLINKSFPLLYLLGIVVIFMSYHSLSYDYQSKSIRYLFLANKSRKEILLSKIIAMFLMTIWYTTLIIITVLITSYLLTHENIFSITNIFMYKNEYIKVPFIIHYFLKTLLYTFPLLFICILTFTLTILLKGGSISLIIVMILYLLSVSLTNLSLLYNLKFIKYTFLPYLDYTYFNDLSSVYLNNAIYNTSFSYCNSFIIFLIFIVIFLFISFKLIKKDV